MSTRTSSPRTSRPTSAPVPAEWPSMAAAHARHRSVMIAGKLYRTVSDKCWTTARRLADLPAMGLRRQAISPMPELLSYWMAAADALQLLRYLNETIADDGRRERRRAARPGRRAAAGPRPGDRRARRTHGHAGLRRRRDRQQHQRRADRRSVARSASSRPARRWAPPSSCMRSSRPGWSAWSARRRCSRCWPIRATSASPPPR